MIGPHNALMAYIELLSAFEDERLPSSARAEGLRNSFYLSRKRVLRGTHFFLVDWIAKETLSLCQSILHSLTDSECG